MTDRPPSLSLRVRGTVELLKQQSRLLPKNAPQARALLDLVSRTLPWSNGKETDAMVAGVPSRLLLPDGASQGLLLYVHGGGFHGGSFPTHARFVRAIASALGRRTVFPLYRLSPEHVFPAALDDVTQVLSSVMGETDDAVVVADSAGATLALAAWQRLAPRRLRAMALVSPWLDLSCSAPSVDASPNDYLEPEVMRRLAAVYLGGADPRSPLASPRFASLTGLPPTLILSGGEEVMRHEIGEFVQRGRDANAIVEHDEAAGLPHAYPLVPLFSPERSRAVDLIRAFVMRQTD